MKALRGTPVPIAKRPCITWWAPLPQGRGCSNRSLRTGSRERWCLVLFYLTSARPSSTPHPHLWSVSKACRVGPAGKERSASWHPYAYLLFSPGFCCYRAKNGAFKSCSRRRAPWRLSAGACAAITKVPKTLAFPDRSLLNTQRFWANMELVPRGSACPRLTPDLNARRKERSFLKARYTGLLL